MVLIALAAVVPASETPQWRLPPADMERITDASKVSEHCHYQHGILTFVVFRTCMETPLSGYHLGLLGVTSNQTFMPGLLSLACPQQRTSCFVQ